MVDNIQRENLHELRLNGKIRFCITEAQRNFSWQQSYELRSSDIKML